VVGGWESVILDIPFTSIADPRDLANAAGLGGTFGVPDFLWVAGDGNTPTIGPALTVIGAPTVGATPYQLEDGTNVVSEVHTGTSYRRTATAVDPTIGQDIIVSALVKKPNTFPGISAILSTRTGFGGVTLRFQGTLLLGFVHDNVGVITPNISATDAALVVLQMIIDGNGNTYIVSNGSANAPTPTPAAGVLGSGAGVGVGGYPDGFGPMDADGSIIFVSFEYGNGIADAWIAGGFARCVDFANRFTGLYPVQGDTPTFARASAASWEDHDGIWHIASPGLPRAGDENGLRDRGVARTNKCYNTINPQLTTGWSVTGGTHTVPSDAAQLLTDGLQNWGPAVHQFVPGAGDQIIYGGAVSANTNDHSSSVFMRGAAGGESVDIVGRDVSAGTTTNLGTVVLTTSWVRYIVDGWTPADTDIQFGLDCDAGDTILFIAPQLEEGATATTPIPNWATAATATRAAEVLTTMQALSDVRGAVEAKLTPMNFSAADIIGSPVVLDRATTPTLLMYMNAAGWRAGDGTNTVTSGTPTDGVENKVKTQWRTGKLSIESDVVRDSGSYDGALTGTGNLTVEPGEETQIKDLKVYE
jgi:hypothetical protein